jgi:hypothetical protein
VKGYCDMLQNSLSQQFKENIVFCCLMTCLQHDSTQPHTAPHTVKQNQDLKLEVLPHPRYSPYLAPSDLHFWPLKDATHGHNFRSNVTGWHNNQKTPSPDNLGLSGMLEKVCRMWWGWHWRLMSLSLSVFAIYHLYNFSGFHLNDPCSSQWPVSIRWVRVIYFWASNQTALLVWSLQH